MFEGNLITTITHASIRETNSDLHRGNQCLMHHINVYLKLHLYKIFQHRNDKNCSLTAMIRTVA